MRRARIPATLVCAIAACAFPGAAQALQGPSPGAVSTETLKLPDKPASIRGLSDAATVNVFMGQLAYEVPFELPAGPGGFGPSLAMRYSGQLGNGPLGIGWEMGTVAIRRSLRQGVPAYDDTDELDLIGIGPGGRLIRDPGIDGRYWVEGQGHLVRVDRAGLHFEVRDGAGNHYFLGVDDEGLETAEGKTVGWRARFITNVVGQTIELHYRHDQNEVYLQQIVWGGAAAPLLVDVAYEARPDVTTSYRTGYQIRTALRAAHVTVTAFGEVLCVYDLTYDDTTYPVSRLTRVHARGRGGRNALPDLSFSYVRQQAAAVTALDNVGGWVLNSRGVTLLDVDGDGMSDLVRLELGNHQYRKNMGGRFLDPRPLTGAGDVDLGSCALMDVDGDARADLVHVVDDTWRVDRLVGEQWQSLGEWPGTKLVPLHDASAVLADLNGDGRTDVVRGTASGIVVNFGRANGLSADVVGPRIQSDAEIEPGNANLRFTDMNGDGLADAVWLTDSWMKVFLGRGDGRFVPFALIKYPWLLAGQDPVVNLADLVLVDLDRDGLVDLVRFTAGHVVWYQGLPGLAFAATARSVDRPEAVDTDAVVTVADVNGNGSADIVWSSPRGMWALDIAGHGSAGMLESISNGLGKVTTVSYSTSALLSVEAEAAGVPWQSKLPISVPVPTETAIDPGAGDPPRVIGFGVRDGFWDGQERRFGGFLEGHQTFAADANQDVRFEETHFDAGLGNDRELRGKVRMVRVLNGLGDLISVTVNDLRALPVDGLPDTPLARKPAVAESDVSQYEATAAPAVTTTTFQFDGEVRPFIEMHSGLITPGDEKVVTRQFASDDVDWIRDRVYFEEVTDGAGNLAGRTQNYFGAPGGDPLPLGTVGQGFARRTDGYLLEEARWVTQTQHAYDNCGNATQIYEDGVFRAVGYDSACLHPTSETVVPADGAASLAWSLAWDNVLDKPTLLTDPNGDTHQIVYDDLARPISESVNGGAPHLRYVYDWVTPRPRTTACSWDGSSDAIPPGGAGCPGGAGWRTVVSVANGAGEDLFTSTNLRDGRFLIAGWKERNHRGEVVLMAEPFYSAIDLPTSRPQSGVRIETLHHDVLGRVDLQTLPNGSQKRTTFAPVRVTVSSPELADVTSVLDGLGRIVHTERAVDTGLETVDATYDGADRIVALTLQQGPGQVVHAFTYDTLGRMIRGNDPDTGDRHLVYDDRNFLVQHTNGVGQSVFFDYDNAGRLVRRGDALATNAATDYVYTYDADPGGPGATCHVVSRLAVVQEPAGQVHFCYDAFGRQDGLARSITVPDTPTSSGGVAQTFSPSGLLLGEQFDDGFVTSYRYDGAGRSVAISSGGSDLWAADAIDAAGRVTSEHYGNGVEQTYGYDQLGLPSHIEVDRPAGAGSLYEVSVTHNSYGAPTIVTDLDGQGLDQTATFGYDLGGRLTGSTLGQGSDQFRFTFAYDLLQNMVRREVKGPKQIGVLAGVYRYGERGYGPRQLTSVVPGGSP
jgi:YD repeat-containing protein